MNKEEEKIKKISRKDIANMSAKDVLRASVQPYRKLLSYLKPYKTRFGLGILFGALYGAMNGILVWTIKHVSQTVFGDQGGPSLAMVGQTDMTSSVSLQDIFLVCAMIPLIMGVRGLFGYLNAYCMMWTSLRVLNDIRTELFANLLNQSLGFFGRAKAGDLIQTVFNQTRMAQTALTTIASDVIKQPVSILSALVVLFYIDWKFTLAALLLFPVCIVPVAVIGKKVRKSGGREEEEAGMLMVVMQEAFAGVRVVKSHAREEYEQKRFNRANENMLRLILRWQKAMEMVGPMVETFASFGIAMALVYAWMLDLGAAKFLALNGGLILLYPPFKMLSRIHILMQKCLAATTKVFELMEAQSEIEDDKNAIKLENGRGHVVYKNVSFSYTPGTNAVEKLNLDIEPGKTYALVGPSGAGKSTLFSLLLRFYDPDKGRIFVDGHDIRKLTQQSLREHIGIVNQDTFLFHDTIYNNILYGKLDATKEDVERAAQQAYAHDFILEQPDGYETVVGDKGCLLSGGQQQRVSIARAILRNAPILLLDEATSALDTESEKKIQNALENLAKGKTVIAIAHRLSTILKSDKIVVMQAGKVEAVGRHEELLEISPQYRRLYDLQFSHREENPLPVLAD